jgi:hypothetical protein
MFDVGRSKNALICANGFFFPPERVNLSGSTARSGGLKIKLIFTLYLYKHPSCRTLKGYEREHGYGRRHSGQE